MNRTSHLFDSTERGTQNLWHHIFNEHITQHPQEFFSHFLKGSRFHIHYMLDAMLLFVNKRGWTTGQCPVKCCSQSKQNNPSRMHVKNKLFSIKNSLKFKLWSLDDVWPLSDHSRAQRIAFVTFFSVSYRALVLPRRRRQQLNSKQHVLSSRYPLFTSMSIHHLNIMMWIFYWKGVVECWIEISDVNPSAASTFFGL